jgi:2-oxoglutarate ferredoxin oxidoreductase subunit alpha
LSAEDLEKAAQYFRYSPEDENHVAARTFPGVDSKGSYFIRGSGHNKLGGYTENPDEYQEVMDRLKLKHKAAAKFVPAPIIQNRQGTNGEPARFGVLSLGGCDPAVREALDILAAQGVPADYLRVCGFPFAESVEEFLNSHEFTFVIEQNRDAQLKALLTLETAVAKDKMRSVLIYGGFPLSARHVVDEILKHDDILKPITMETGN